MAHKNVIFLDKNNRPTEPPKGFFNDKKKNWGEKLLLFIKKLLRV